MKTHLFFILFFTVLLSHNDCFSLKKKWDNFKTHFKVLIQKDKEIIGYDNFKNCLKRIRLHNRHETRYKLGVNQFCHKSLEELKFLFSPILYDHQETNQSKIYKPKNINLPKKIDWRLKGVVTPQKTQSTVCGSCYAVGTTDGLESHYALKHKKQVVFSEQQIVDCSVLNNGCHGGLPTNCYRYWIEYGSIKMKDYPITIWKKKCNYKQELALKTVTDFIVLPYNNEYALQEALTIVGPIVTEIRVSNVLTIGFYRAGIIYNKNCYNKNTNHVVLTIGFGVSKSGEEYYIIKNGWGKWWGKSGYFLMARNRGNQCKIASGASYPII